MDWIDAFIISALKSMYLSLKVPKELLQKWKENRKGEM